MKLFIAGELLFDKYISPKSPINDPIEAGRARIEAAAMSACIGAGVALLPVLTMGILGAGVGFFLGGIIGLKCVLVSTITDYLIKDANTQTELAANIAINGILGGIGLYANIDNLPLIATCFGLASISDYIQLKIEENLFNAKFSQQSEMSDNTQDIELSDMSDNTQDIELLHI